MSIGPGLLRRARRLAGLPESAPVTDGGGRLLFAFTGGSASWPAMGRTGYARSRPFRDAIDEAGSVVDDVLGWNPAAHFRGIVEPPESLCLARRNDIGRRPVRFVDTMRTDDEEGSWNRALAAVRTRPPAAIARPTYSASTVLLKDPAIEARLFDVYEALRAAGSPQFLARTNSWIVLDFESVQRALAQPLVFSSRTPTMVETDPVLLAEDPPQHTAVRRLLARHFSRDAVARRAALAERTAEQLLEPLRSGQAIDAIADFATPLAHTIAADLTGLPADVVRRLADCTLAARGDMRSVYRLVDATIQDAAPRSRLYGELLQDAAGALDAAAARSLVRLLWVAATTPKRVLGSAILLLLEHPKIRSLVEARPELLGAFVDEAIRLRPGEHLITRVTTDAVEVRGVTIPAGANVQLCLAAANRDPSVYPDPSSIHLTGRTTAHVSFGAGIHRCIGGALGQAVILTGVRALFRAAPHFRAAQPLSTVRYAPGATFREVEQIVIVP